MFDLKSLEVAYTNILPSLVSVVSTTAFFFVLYYVTKFPLKTFLKRTGIQETLVRILIHTLYKWTLVLIALLVVLPQLGVDVTAALAGIGILGIAIGFAAKESLANIMAGFVIFSEKLYKTGEWIDVKGHYGQVKNITLRTTRIRTRDNVFVILPNNEIINNPVINSSAEGMLRVSASIGIAYKESVDEARKVLLQYMKGIEGVRSDPPPDVVVNSLGDSSVNLLARIWIDDAGKEISFRFKLIEGCKKALDEAGIEIPYPHREVFINQRK